MGRKPKKVNLPSMGEETENNEKKVKKSDRENEKPTILKGSKIFNNESGVEHSIYQNIPDSLIVKEDCPKGTRVLVSKYPDFYKIFLFRYYKSGEPSFPRGGVKVWNDTDQQMQCFYYESVAIHPKGGCYRFIDADET